MNRLITILILSAFLMPAAFSQTTFPLHLGIDCGVPVKFSDTGKWESINIPPKLNTPPNWVYKEERFSDGGSLLYGVYRPCGGYINSKTEYRIDRNSGWFQKRTITSGLRYEKKKTEYEELLEKYNLHE